MSSFRFSLRADVKHTQTHTRCCTMATHSLVQCESGTLSLIGPPRLCFLCSNTVKTLCILQAHVWFLFLKAKELFFLPCLFLPLPAELPTCCIRSTIVWKINPNLCSSFQGSADSLFRFVETCWWGLAGGEVVIGLVYSQSKNMQRGWLESKRCVCVCARVCLAQDAEYQIFWFWLFYISFVLWWINREYFILSTAKV